MVVIIMVIVMLANSNLPHMGTLGLKGKCPSH